MKICLLGFICCFIIFKTNDGIPARFNIAPIDDGTKDAEEELVLDIIKARSDDNIVLVTDADNIDILERDVTSKNMSDQVPMSPVITRLLTDSISTSILKDLQVLNVKANRQSFYIIMITEERRIIPVIRKIQGTDHESKIAIIYSRSFDDGRMQKLYVSTIAFMYERLRLYNVYIFIKDSTSYKVYDVCRFCAEGKDLVAMINTWSTKRGFRNSVMFQSSFRGNYHEKIILMGSPYQKPNIHVEEKKSDGQVELDGILYRDYKVIFDSLNATLKVIEAKGELRFDDRAYMYGVVYGYLNIMGGGYLCKLRPFEVVGDISTGTHVTDGYSIISMKPVKGIQPQKAFFTPFKKYTWMVLMSSIPLAWLVLHGLRRFSSAPDKKANLWNDLWDVIVIVCWDGIRSPQPSFPIIIHLSAFMFAFYIIISLYLGDFASHLLSPQYVSKPIDTLEDLWESGKKWVEGDQSEIKMWNKYFNYVSGIKEKHVNFAAKQNESTTATALRLVAENPDELVYLAMTDVARFHATEYSIKVPKGRYFHFSKEKFKGSSACLYYKKNYAGKEALNRKIMSLHASGINQFNMNSYTFKNFKSSQILYGKSGKSLDLVLFKHFKVSLYFLGLAYGVGVLILIIEVIVYRAITVQRRREKEKPTKIKVNIEEGGCKDSFGCKNHRDIKNGDEISFELEDIMDEETNK